MEATVKAAMEGTGGGAKEVSLGGTAKGVGEDMLDAAKEAEGQGKPQWEVPWKLHWEQLLELQWSSAFCIFYSFIDRFWL